VVRPDFEGKVLGRVRPVNPDQLRERQRDNASISKSTEPVTEMERISPSARGNQLAFEAGKWEEGPDRPLV